MHCKIYGHKIGGLGYAGMGGMVHFAGVFAVLFLVFGNGQIHGFSLVY